MYVRDIMTTKVTTIPSNTSIIKARKVMDSGRFRRLPVVEKGELVGIVTAGRLEKLALSEGALRGAYSTWELAYTLGSLYRTNVKNIMQNNVVTATPDMTIEEALAEAESYAEGDAIILVTGSIFLIAAARAVWRERSGVKDLSYKYTPSI